MTSHGLLLACFGTALSGFDGLRQGAVVARGVCVCGMTQVVAAIISRRLLSNSNPFLLPPIAYLFINHP